VVEVCCGVEAGGKLRHPDASASVPSFSTFGAFTAASRAGSGR
jgi:hypothetical protein